MESKETASESGIHGPLSCLTLEFSKSSNDYVN
jgi:hypothetical protein